MLESFDFWISFDFYIIFNYLINYIFIVYLFSDINKGLNSKIDKIVKSSEEKEIEVLLEKLKQLVDLALEEIYQEAKVLKT
jgi:hypothetical protein